MGDNDTVPLNERISSPENYTIEDRTCQMGNITELIIHFWDINSMRATEPKCVQEGEKSATSIGGRSIDNYLGPNTEYNNNTGYRDTSIVVQLVTTDDHTVIYENADYEHLKSEYLLDNDIGDKVACGDEDNEYLRAYKDPDHEAFEGNPGNPGDGDGEGDRGSGSGGGDEGREGGVEVNPLGEVLTKSVTATGRAISSSRVSWREVLE